MSNLTKAQVEKIESLQNYLTRIANNLARNNFPSADPQDLLQMMNETIVTQQAKTPKFLSQSPKFICQRAAWGAQAAYRKYHHINMRKSRPQHFANEIKLDSEENNQAELIGTSRDNDTALSVAQALVGLSEKTLEIAQLLADGWKRQDIAKKLGVSRVTVHNHTKKLQKALAGI